MLAGYFSLVVTGLTTAGPALAVGVTWPRVIAAALSLGLTSGLMVLFKSPHPPAGATTLIISLGLITKPLLLIVLLVAVMILTLKRSPSIGWRVSPIPSGIRPRNKTEAQDKSDERLLS